MLTDAELWEKCKTGNPITCEDLGISKNENPIIENIRRNNTMINEIKDLKITDVEIWNENAEDKNIGIRLSWSCNLGFGQYTIGFYGGNWYVDSECMESPEDRDFGRLVLNTWLEDLKNNPIYKFGEIG